MQEKLLPLIAPKHKGLFSFGFEALTMRPYVSLNGNARVTIANRSTAESKIYRLVGKKIFHSYFTQLVMHLKLIMPTDTINVDFSTFCGFQALTFAKQTYLGRSIPLYFALIRYPIDEGSQTRFIMEEIKKFVLLLGFSPHLVFDRGFESPYLTPFLVREKIPFTIRFKKDKHISYQMRKIPLRNLPWFENDCMVEVYTDIILRVVVSEKKKDMEESWYLITNDAKSKRDEVIARYYFRFEIEETFKDLKYIQELKKFFRIKTERTFKVLLWFCILSVWLTFLLEKTKQYLRERVQHKRRKRLSVMRFFAESIQLEMYTFFKKQFF